MANSKYPEYLAIVSYNQDNNICDQACENKPSGHLKITYFFNFALS